MQRVDLVIAALAVVAVIGSAVGMVVYDQDDGTDRWELTFPIQSATASNVAGFSFTESGERPWTLQQANITMVSFTVQITGDRATRAQDLQVEIEFESPGGLTGTLGLQLDAGGDNTASGTVDVPIESRPDARTVDATNRTNALADLPVGTNGTGEWTIRAQVTGGALPAVPETLTVAVDAEYEYWMVDVSSVSPDISPAL